MAKQIGLATRAQEREKMPTEVGTLCVTACKPNPFGGCQRFKKDSCPSNQYKG
jgi:hypothetical protein